MRPTDPRHDPDPRVALLADWIDWIEGVHLAYDALRGRYVDTRAAPVYARRAVALRRREALAAAYDAREAVT